MRVMGIDPGLNATGYGVLDAQGGSLRVVTAGTIRPPTRRPLATRLRYLYDRLAQVIQTYRPSVTVLEALYTHHQYLTTAAMMAHARGIACLASAHHDLPVIDYLPTRVKKALTGRGTASKEQVARMVETWLGANDASWSSDATDALALAITHAHVDDGRFASEMGRGALRRRSAVVAAGVQG